MKSLKFLILIFLATACAKDTLNKAALVSNPSNPGPADPAPKLRTETDVQDKSGNNIGAFLGYSGYLAGQNGAQFGLVLRPDSSIVNADMVGGTLKSESLVFLSTDCTGQTGYIRTGDFGVPLVMKGRIVLVNGSYYKFQGFSGTALTAQSYYVNGACAQVTSAVIDKSIAFQVVTDSVTDFSLVAPLGLVYQ